MCRPSFRLRRLSNHDITTITNLVCQSSSGGNAVSAMKLDKLSDAPPILDLGTYILRPLRSEDTPAWYEYLCDAEVTQFTSYNIASIDAVAKFIENYLADYKHQRSSRWAIAEKNSDRLVGTCGFYGWNADHDIAELGYDLSKHCWGTGLMTQAVRRVTQWGFEELALNRIQATVMVGNTRSARVLEKCGFQREGTLREYKICRGQPSDFWIFAQLHSHYAQLVAT